MDTWRTPRSTTTSIKDGVVYPNGFTSSAFFTPVTRRTCKSVTKYSGESFTIDVAMGVRLSRPITEKLTESGENSRLEYAVASMQGWRKEMEDAHICETDLTSEMSFFGVFDGHGGKEVALFTARHIAKEFLAAKKLHSGVISLALKRSFLSIDELVAAPSSQEELHKLGSSRNPIHFPLDKAMEAEKAKFVPALPEDCLDSGTVGPNLNSYPIKMDPLVVETESEEEERESNNIKGSLASSDEENSKSVSSRILSILFALGCLHSNDPSRMQIKKQKTKQNRRSLCGLSSKRHSISPDLELKDSQETESEKKALTKAAPIKITTAGCTSVVAVITNNSLHVANAGDSRCVLCHDGVAMPMSRDHKPTDPTEFSRIATAGGFVYDGRVNGCLNLSRAIGDLDYKRSRKLRPENQMITANPEIRSVSLRLADEFVILACDGIWDVMTRQQACDFVSERLKQKLKLQDICNELCDFCCAEDLYGFGEGCDNMTVIIILLKDYSSSSY